MDEEPKISVKDGKIIVFSHPDGTVEEWSLDKWNEQANKTVQDLKDADALR